MLQNIKKNLLVKGWQVTIEKNKITVFKNDKTGNMIPETTFICDENNIYYYYQGEFSVFSSFGNLLENFICIYCLVDDNKGKIRRKISDDLKIIRKSSSFEQIEDIFFKYFDKSYLDLNLNFELDITKNNALNLAFNKEWFSINYILDDKMLPITEVNSINRAYGQILPHLLLKREFQKDVLPILKEHGFSAKKILEFYNIYANGNCANILNLNKKKEL